LHGMIFRNIKAIEPEYTTWLHDGNGGKPFALTPLRVKGRPVDKPERCSAGEFLMFQVGVWEEKMEHCISQAFMAERKVHVGKLSFEIAKVTCVSRWDPKNEANTSSIRSGFIIPFYEPTAFRSKGTTRLFPEPRLVLGSLSQKWLQATGEKISADVLLEMEAKILPARYALRTCALQMDRFFITGFVGQCAYMVDSSISAQCLAHLSSLLRIIPYTGIGCKTTMGMGVADFMHL